MPSKVEWAFLVGEAELARGDDVSIAHEDHPVDGDIVGQGVGGMRREKDGKRVGGLGGFGGILGLEVEERIHSPNLADRPVFHDIEFLESALFEVLIEVRTVDQRVVIARGEEFVKLVAKFRSIVAVLGNNGDARSFWQEEPRGRCLEGRIGRLASTGKDREQTQNQRAGGVECLEHGMNADFQIMAACFRLSRRNGKIQV